ncbi:TIGR03745 family integrating conjugative element membrane protein [Vibrio mediterranei]
MIQRIHKGLVSLSTLLSGVAQAGLPTAANSQSAQKGDYIGMGREFAKEGTTLGTELFGVGLLIVVVLAAAYCYWQVQQEKKKWSDLTSTIVGGLVIAVVGIILLTQAGSIL